MLPKAKRTQSKKNLSVIKSLPCFVCDRRPTDADHIKSKGAGGGDDLNNLNALCRQHHVERHSIGLKQFLNRYSTIISISREKYDIPPMKIDFID